MGLLSRDMLTWQKLSPVCWRSTMKVSVIFRSCRELFYPMYFNAWGSFIPRALILSCHQESAWHIPKSTSGFPHASRNLHQCLSKQVGLRLAIRRKYVLQKSIYEYWEPELVLGQTNPKDTNKTLIRNNSTWRGPNTTIWSDLSLHLQARVTQAWA